MEIPLTEAKGGTDVKVARIAAGFGMQQHLASLGVEGGSVVRRLGEGQELLHGPVMVEIGGDRIAIGSRMAQKIIVSEIEDG